MSDEGTALAREVRYFHELLFHTEPPEVVVDRYVAANQLCFPDLDPRDFQMVATIVAKQLDAEAIELVLRLRRRSLVLTRKIQILFYLVEVRAEYYGYFVNQMPGLCRAVLRLAGAVLRTVWKCGKGWYLVWRYDFV